jgi:TonB family protein
MKKIIFSSLIAMLMLASCQNEEKKEQVKADTTADVPFPPPIVQQEAKDSVPPPPQPPKDDTDQVYSFVGIKTPPTYPGGIEKFYEFLGKNIKYPPLAIEKKVEGNVQVSFIVEKDGSITAIKVERKLGYGTDEEAIRVLKLAKKWNPGMNEGKAVRVKYALPIKFTLKK